MHWNGLALFEWISIWYCSDCSDVMNCLHTLHWNELCTARCSFIQSTLGKTRLHLKQMRCTKLSHKSLPPSLRWPIFKCARNDGPDENPLPHNGHHIVAGADRFRARIDFIVSDWCSILWCRLKPLNVLNVKPQTGHIDDAATRSECMFRTCCFNNLWLVNNLEHISHICVSSICSTLLQFLWFVCNSCWRRYLLLANCLLHVEHSNVIFDFVWCTSIICWSNVDFSGNFLPQMSHFTIDENVASTSLFSGLCEGSASSTIKS